MKMKDILQSFQQGILVCDRQGCVVYANEAYCDFVEIPLLKMQGKPIKNFRPGTFVPRVLQSQKPVENLYRKEGGQEYFANIYPIVEKNQVIGTVSIITRMEGKRLEEECQALTLKERVERFEIQQIRDMISLYGDTVEGKKKAAKELGISLSTLYEKLAKEI